MSVMTRVLLVSYAKAIDYEMTAYLSDGLLCVLWMI